jgi:hypothetical protein
MFLKDVELWLKRGAICPIFEGDMPPKKMYPKYWRQYWRHNRNPVKYYPLGRLRLDPRAVSPNQSGVTTTPLDGVSVILIELQIF